MNWLITPFWLLVVFVALAVCAFFTFVWLTHKRSTPRRDDWKKFLSSFAATAVVLSVGFMSLMWQQDNQSQQYQAEQSARARVKLNEENGQIRARLLYSVVQKNFELELFLADDRLKPETIKKICGASTDQQNRGEPFSNYHAPYEPAKLELIKAVLKRLFSSEAYERYALNRLMKETSFSTRIDQEMLSHFLTDELELNFVGPQVANNLLELSSINDAVSFCKQFDRMEQDYENLVRDVIKLQLSTCVAYAIVGMPIDDGVKQSALAFSLIQRFYVSGSDQEKDIAIQKFRLDLVGKVAGMKPELDSCLAHVSVDLKRLP